MRRVKSSDQLYVVKALRETHPQMYTRILVEDLRHPTDRLNILEGQGHTAQVPTERHEHRLQVLLDALMHIAQVPRRYLQGNFASLAQKPCVVRPIAWLRWHDHRLAL